MSGDRGQGAWGDDPMLAGYEHPTASSVSGGCPCLACEKWREYHPDIVVNLGTPKASAWCPTCALPSAVEIPLYRVAEDGVCTAGTIRRCDHEGVSS